MQSKYLAFFRQLKERQPGFYQLFGSRILVEVLPEPEMKTAGGLVIASSSRQITDTQENKFTAAVVIAVGKGYYDDESGEDVALSVKPGQVVEVVRTGLRKYSTHPMLGGQYSGGELATTRESDITGLLADSVDEYASVLTTITELQLGK